MNSSKNILFGLSLFFSGIVLGKALAEVSFKKNGIKSSILITPEWKLHTDGKRIDTIFIYKKQ